MDEEKLTQSAPDLIPASHQCAEVLVQQMPLKQLKKPNVEWNQTEYTITLTVFIPDLVTHSTRTYDVPENKGSTVSFQSLIPEGYGFDLTLLGKLRHFNPVSEKITGQYLELKLEKLSSGYYWPYLIAVNDKPCRWLQMKFPLGRDEIEESGDEENMYTRNGISRYLSCHLTTSVIEVEEAELSQEIALVSHSSSSCDENEDDIDFDFSISDIEVPDVPI